MANNTICVSTVEAVINLSREHYQVATRLIQIYELASRDNEGIELDLNLRDFANQRDYIEAVATAIAALPEPEAEENKLQSQKEAVAMASTLIQEPHFPEKAMAGLADLVEGMLEGSCAACEVKLDPELPDNSTNLIPALFKLDPPYDTGTDRQMEGLLQAISACCSQGDTLTLSMAFSCSKLRQDAFGSDMLVFSEGNVLSFPCFNDSHKDMANAIEQDQQSMARFIAEKINYAAISQKGGASINEKHLIEQLLPVIEGRRRYQQDRFCASVPISANTLIRSAQLINRLTALAELHSLVDISQADKKSLEPDNLNKLGHDLVKSLHEDSSAHHEKMALQTLRINAARMGIDFNHIARVLAMETIARLACENYHDQSVSVLGEENNEGNISTTVAGEDVDLGAVQTVLQMSLLMEGNDKVTSIGSSESTNELPYGALLVVSARGGAYFASYDQEEILRVYLESCQKPRPELDMHKAGKNRGIALAFSPS